MKAMFISELSSSYLEIIPDCIEIRLILNRGVFGSHVSAVFRRLCRVCNYYGSSPQFICCSATLEDPRSHMTRLLPCINMQDIEVISKEDESCPQGERSDLDISYFESTF